MIRECRESDFNTIFEIINDAAQAYKRVIPEDRWRQLLGVMGIQDKGDVTLIRHAYVWTRAQKTGIGTKLLQHLESMTEKPMLIGTWAAASWAISFYEKNGYTLVLEEEKNRLLRKYWSIPGRQVETSVVLANQTWSKAQHVAPTAD